VEVKPKHTFEDLQAILAFPFMMLLALFLG
jgi:hypothetical protein